MCWFFRRFSVFLPLYKSHNYLFQRLVWCLLVRLNFSSRVVDVVGIMEPSVPAEDRPQRGLCQRTDLNEACVRGQTPTRPVSEDRPQRGLYQRIHNTNTQTAAGCVVCWVLGVCLWRVVEGGVRLGCVRTKASSAVFASCGPSLLPLCASFSLFSKGTLNEKRWDLRLILQRCDFIPFLFSGTTH